MSLQQWKRPASVVAATLTLLAAFAGMQTIPASTFALDLSPLHRDAEPGFHADSYNPATPPQFQTNNSVRQGIDRHPRHRAL